MHNELTGILATSKMILQKTVNMQKIRSNSGKLTKSSLNLLLGQIEEIRTTNFMLKAMSN